MNLSHKKLVAMTEIALMAAVICVLAPFSLTIPVSPVPITLGTFAVYLTAAILGSKRSTISVLIYLFIGAVGVPVFSNFSGGLPKLVGATGGYLIGYIPCAFLIGFLIEKVTKKWMVPIALVGGTVVLYLIGTVWLMKVAGFPSFLSACAAGVFPYLPLDAVKIILASVIAIPVRSLLLKNNYLDEDHR